MGLFAVYHLVLGIALITVADRSELLKSASADLVLFGAVAQIYVIAAILFVTLSVARRPPYSTQAYGILLFDTAALTLLMHAAGGAGSGYGLLLAVSLALGVLLTGGISPILFAALASTAVIGEQIYAHLTDDAPLVGFLHAGLLGAAYFSIGLLNFVLSRRLDTTARIIQKQEVDLADLNRINELVIGLLDLGVIVVDADGRTKIANQVAKSWLDSPLEGSIPVSTLSSELADSFTLWRSSPSSDNLSNHILEINDKELGVEFRDLGENKYRGTIILMKDMARVRAESHNIKLAAIGQMSAGIAHDIRNPLSAISQGAQLLCESQTTGATERQIAEMLVRNCNRLDAVVENILSLARKQDPSLRKKNLCPFLEAAAEQLRSIPLTAAARITVDCHSDDYALMDPKQIEEVLTLLVENAIRHSRPGEDPIVTLVATLSNDGQPVIEVRDNGPGIPADLARKIFDPFFSTSTGTGLGLFLARQFCHANRASLKLGKPTPGIGASFRITLHSEKAPEDQSEPLYTR